MTAAPAAQPERTSTLPRLDSVDLLRGAVMIFMALDHTRDFFHFGAIHGVDPTDLDRTTPAVFLTRWITHYCAPIFSFLAGTGVFFSVARGKPKADVSRFLVTRGLWLIFLELTFFYWAWTFGFDPHFNEGLVIWALGWSMIVLAALIHLPVWGVTAFGVAMIALHNAFDRLTPESFGRWSGLWKVLHVQSMVEVSPSFHFLILYPLIPWVGVMAVGYGFGVVFTLDSATRRKWLMRLGLGLIAAFVILRWSNLYGDPRAWSAQSRPLFTLFSFLNCTKYPPSLCYLLMTLGPAFLLLALFERGTPAALKPVLTIGRVPMFYYLLHIPLIHGLASLWFHLHDGRADFFEGGTGTAPADAGFSLPVVYLIWLGVVVGLYPACRWFAALKRRRQDAWLSYF